MNQAYETTITELYHLGHLHIKTYLFCVANHLDRLQDLQNHIDQFETFKILDQCGPTTDKELKLVLHYYHGNTPDAIYEEDNQFLVPLIKQLNPYLKSVIKDFLFLETKTISDKAYRVLKLMISEITIERLVDVFFIPKLYALYDIPDLHVFHIRELENFFAKVKRYVIDVQKFQAPQIVKQNRRSSSIRVLESEKLLDIVLDNRDRSIFQVMDDALKNGRLFNDFESAILTQGTTIYQHAKVTNSTLMHKFGLSNDQILSIKEFCIHKLQYIRFSHADRDFLKSYGLDMSQHYIQINLQTATLIRQESGDFSKDFILFILYLFVKEDYVLLGNPSEVLRLKTYKLSDQHVWSHFHLIKKELVQHVDFEAMAQDIHLQFRYHGRHLEPIELKTFIQPYSYQLDPPLSMIATSITRKFLYQEFEEQFYTYPQVYLTRYSNMYHCYYVFLALKDIGAPTTVPVIHHWILEHYPNLGFTQITVLKACQKQEAGIQRWYTLGFYGLGIWDFEPPTFQGSDSKKRQPVVDFVFDMLQSVARPLSQYDVLLALNASRYVTTAPTLNKLLTQDAQKRFVMYPNQFIGLAEEPS